MSEQVYSAAEVAEANKIGEASGMGVPDLNTPIGAEEAQNDGIEATEVSSEKTKNTTEEVSVADNKKDDTTTAKSEERHSRADTNSAKTVPYGLFKDTDRRLKELQKEIEQLKTNNGKNDESDEKLDDIQIASKQLAEELGVDEVQIEKILKTAVSLTSKQKTELPQEIQEKLKTLDLLQEKQKLADGIASFDKEFVEYIPDLKKQYPNASDSELSQAKIELDKLAHTKDFHNKELDYIVYKNKQIFDTILKVSASKKSGENSKRIGKEQEYDRSSDDENIVDIENMTPEIMKDRENKRLSSVEASPKDYRIQHPIR